MESTSDNVLPMARPRMTEGDYTRERLRIYETYGDSKRSAAARWEQELALLFWRSNWTQQEIAIRERKSPQYIARLLKFGTFLNFSPSGRISSEDLSSLTERGFRQYWDRTDGSQLDTQRFKQVLAMLEDNIANPVPRSGRTIIADLREQADGKWHTAETMAREIDKPADDVEKTLVAALHSSTTRYKVERRKRGRDMQYRIFPTEKRVSTFELIEALSPLIEQLKTESRKHQARVSTPTLANIAAILQESLDRWCQ